MKRLEVFIYVLGGSIFAAAILQAAHDFCHGKPCPEYTLIQKNEDFEERAYVDTLWITTQVPSSGVGDLLAGGNRLKRYCNKGNKKGKLITLDTWPGLITITEGEGGTGIKVSVSWFVPAGTELPDPTDPSVIVEEKPPATVYVRVFDGQVTLENAQVHMKLLREFLKTAKIKFEADRYIGAGYEGPLYIFTRHNEIWINAARIGEAVGV